MKKSNIVKKKEIVVRKVELQLRIQQNNYTIMYMWYSHACDTMASITFCATTIPNATHVQNTMAPNDVAAPKPILLEMKAS